MANDTCFDTSAPAIAMADFDALEQALGRPLPEAFKQHYLRYNGGAPSDTQVPGDSVWEPTEVAMFNSIKFPLPGQGASSEMLHHYQAMVAKQLIPDVVLPFAWDPGGNLFVLDLRTASVAYYPTDMFDPALDAAGNFAKAQRTVATSFEQFLHNLEPNPDANW
jgi:cell wall assembly regulator SMI1